MIVNYGVQLREFHGLDKNISAPEILKNVPYSYKVDVWSLGVIMYYVLTGIIPYSLSDGDFDMIQSVSSLDSKDSSSIDRKLKIK